MEPGSLVMERKMLLGIKQRGRSPCREAAAVDLYWLPLGAGGHSVRLNGRVYEAATRHGSSGGAPSDLYHAGLEVRIAATRFVIEMTPVRDVFGVDRGVVAEGPVGARWAGRFRLFRYEVRRWQDGRIPDVEDAVEGPLRLTEEPAHAQRVLDLVPQVPTLVWGRDELRTGDMWNSNSLVAWLIARSGADVNSVRPPAGGRAPGSHAASRMRDGRRPGRRRARSRSGQRSRGRR